MPKYRSTLEINISKALTKSKVKFEYETVRLDYVTYHSYIPDFILTKKDSTKMYVEAKGYFTSKDRKKLLAVKEDYPSIDLRLLFQKDNYLTKAKNKTYTDWAREHDFLYHVGDRIPQKWIKEIKK